jgi:hypothetical protein
MARQELTTGIAGYNNNIASDPPKTRPEPLFSASSRYIMKSSGILGRCIPNHRHDSDGTLKLASPHRRHTVTATKPSGIPGPLGTHSMESLNRCGVA